MHTILLLVALAAGPPAPSIPAIDGRPVWAWVDDLSSDDVLVREEAAIVLAEAGEAARPALPRLCELTKSGHRPLRGRALIAVWRLGGEAVPAALFLGEELATPSVLSAEEALAMIVRMGPDGAPAVPALLRAGRPSEAVRMGRAAVPPLLAELGGRDADMRRRAATALAALRPHIREDEVPLLGPALLDPVRDVRVEASLLAYALGGRGPTVLAGLAEGLRGPSPGQALLVIDSSTDRPAALAGPCRALLSHADPHVRLWGARILFQTDGDAERVLPIHAACLVGDPAVIADALRGLALLGPAARPALPRLLDLLDADRKGVLPTEEALAAVGADAVPGLVAAWRRGPRPVEAKALAALTRIGPPAVPALAGLLDKEGRRRQTLSALAGMGPAAAAARPALVKLADADALAALADIGLDADEAERLALGAWDSSDRQSSALRLLLSADPAHPRIVPRLLLMLGRPETRADALRWAPAVTKGRERLIPMIVSLLREAPIPAARALGGLAAKEAAGPLLGLLASRDHLVQREALTALRRIGVGADVLSPALVRMLTRREPHEAIRTLGRIGAAAMPARDHLVRLAKGDTPLREKAAFALALIDGTAVPSPRGLTSASAGTRANAAQRLGEVGPAAKTHLPSLTPLLADEEDAVRIEAAVAILRIGGVTEKPVSVMKGVAASHRAGSLRATLATRLEEAGAAARPARAVLEALRDGTDAEASLPARCALRRLP